VNWSVRDEYNLSGTTKILLRTFEFKQAFEDWMLYRSDVEIEVLRKAYETLLLGGESPYLKYEKGDGYEAILWNSLIKQEVNVSFMLDYLRTRIITLKYYNYVSDTKTEVMDGGIKFLFERHYLKPLKGVKLDGDVSPNYGNINLENCKQSDSQNSFLKIMVTYYTGSSAQPFQTLMRELLTP